MEDAKESGQLEGWNQVLDKLAAVLTDLAQAKSETEALIRETQSWRKK
jgi:hypothetical protein